jgi:hypothetical protein
VCAPKSVVYAVWKTAKTSSQGRAYAEVKNEGEKDALVDIAARLAASAVRP